MEQSMFDYIIYVSKILKDLRDMARIYVVTSDISKTASAASGIVRDIFARLQSIIILA